MAVGASNSRTRMDSLVPHFKLRMLRFEHRRARVAMVPVFELLLIIKSEDVLHLKSFGPRIDQTLFRTTEVILVVTLSANVGAHLLPRGLFIHVVVLNTLRSLQARIPSMNAGRVTRNCIVCESWQSIHATGCVTNLRASKYGVLFNSSKPLKMSPPPSCL